MMDAKLIEGQKRNAVGEWSSPNRKFLGVDEISHKVPKSPRQAPEDWDHF